VAAIRPVFVDQYVRLFIWRLRASIIAMGRGIAFPSVSRQQIEALPIPLPPLPEQERIVAKVNELMMLCDRLEAAQIERETRRNGLTAASLFHIINASEGFGDHVRFYLSQFPRHTARLEQILALRQTILSLAVRGRLVSQDPHDQPAIDLLKQIQTERTPTSAGAEDREQKQLQEDVPEKAAFSIPQNWCWATLGQIAFGFRYGTSVKCSYEITGEPVLRIPNVANGRITTKDLKYGSLSEREAEDLRLQLGDILMVRSNGSLDLVGRPALVEANAVGYCYAGYLVRVRTSARHLDGRYLLLALTSRHVRDQIELPIRTTVGLKNVNATELSRLSIPLPPLAEQHRIVKKVDELMTICERLKEELNTARTASGRLLNAVLDQALQDNEAVVHELKALSNG